MDMMVLKTQQWLNKTYGKDSRFKTVSEDGITGWGTIYGLIRALQIELGITSTADNFGSGTKEKFVEQYPNGIIEQSPGDSEERNIYAIIQGGLWCKGYSTYSSEITKHFYSGTAGGIKSLKSDAGVDRTSSTVTLDVMQALLSMNQYVTLWRVGGKSEIREIQQTLNQNYREYIGLAPCDGLYGRDMNTALIKALQAVEGLSPKDATGTFGNTTTAKCPILPDGNNVTSQNKARAIQLLRYALCCNGFSTGSMFGGWDDTLVCFLRSFQAKYAIAQTGRGDLNTWMALLISKGNPNRSAIGCDCATILDSAKANALYDAGYRYVGRYLTGTVGSQHIPKNLSLEELEAIFDAGLKVFTIYQDNTPSVGYFTKTQGKADASKAISAAQELNIPYGEIIYYAIDYDMMDNQVTANVISYFEGIRSIINSNHSLYKIGVYGSRNVCSRVCSKGLAVSSFVSDMSTGYSGNMGYPLPDNWAFDQFNEYTFSRDGVSFALDKDAYSGQYSGFHTLEDHSDNLQIEVPSEDIYLERYRYLLSLMNIKPSAELSLNKKFEYEAGNVKFEYEAGISEFFEEIDGCQYQTVEVNNGKISDIVISASKEIYNGLSEEIQAEVDDDGSLKYAVSFESEIKNGSIKYGLGVNFKQEVMIDYNIEELLWTDSSVDYKLYVKITITIKRSDDDKQYEKLLEATRQCMDSAISAADMCIAAGVRVMSNAMARYQAQFMQEMIIMLFCCILIGAFA